MLIDGEPIVDVRHIDDILNGKLHNTQRVILSHKVLIKQVELEDIFLPIKVFQFKLEELNMEGEFGTKKKIKKSVPGAIQDQVSGQQRCVRNT